MNPIEQILLAGQALRHTVMQIARPRLWLWVVPLALAQLVTIALIAGVAHPLVSWFMAPLLARVAGEGVLHYPGTFERLPDLFQRVDLLWGAVLGAIGIGAATPAFAARFRGERVEARRALGAGFRRAVDLVIVQIPLNAGVLLTSAALSHAGGGAGLRGRLIAVFGTTFTIVLQSLLFYAVARVMLEGRSAWAALRSLPSTWRPGFVPAFTAGVLSLLIVVPLQLPGISIPLLLDRGRPELIVALTLLRVAAGWLNAFLLTGMATLLYLSAVRVAERRA